VRDIRKQVPDASVDVAFDKGTLDAMISGSPWGPPDDVLQNTTCYIDEVGSDHFRKIFQVLAISSSHHQFDKEEGR
jgi:hypothetical protein